MIYLDYAATSFVKPSAVYTTTLHAMRNFSANPGRGGHDLAVKAGEIVYDTREKLCSLFHIHNPEQISFFPNTTAALNAGIKGVLKKGDHVVTSSMEHNSVMRPLAELKRRGMIDYTVVKADASGRLKPEDFIAKCRPDTRLVICLHASNVCGNYYDIGSISKAVRTNSRLFMTDVAQSAGILDIDANQVDLLAFPGHKGLYGPQGTGGLYIKEGIMPATIIEGGTGSRSELLLQPEEMPDRLESGTLNVAAIAGLGAGVDFVMREGVSAIAEHELMLTNYFEEKIRNIERITLLGSAPKVGVTALNLDSYDCIDVANLLNQNYGIAVRSGLHCAVSAHESLGTNKTGCIRFSFGYFTTKKEVDKAIFALYQISKNMYRYM
ncbi:MAG: aminotransferase class V-fold PLP-dependent enzyme [Ruminococcaceae bacterium]|nr:aminotransferase class V-fold PLP-dependent enzyme [Oscillospiraceae bacterium]